MTEASNRHIPQQPGPEAHIADLLKQAGQADPQTATIMRMFSARRAAKAPLAPAAHLSREEQRFARLEQQNAELRRFCRSLAMGLGACPECWGESASCNNCEGLGVPGHFIPSGREYDALVRPAVDAMAHARRSRGEPANGHAGVSAPQPPSGREAKGQ